MLILPWIVTALLVAIFFYDLVRYIIPNWAVGVLLVLWPVALLLAPAVPEGFVWWHSLIVFAVVFAVGLGIFVLGLAGGGDVKLLAVLALWTGTHATFELVAYMALLGGLLAVACLLIRPIVAKFVAVEKAASLPRILRYKEPVPYGIAITLAFLYLLWNGQVAGLPVA